MSLCQSTLWLLVTAAANAQVARQDSSSTTPSYTMGEKLCNKSRGKKIGIGSSFLQVYDYILTCCPGFKGSAEVMMLPWWVFLSLNVSQRLSETDFQKACSVTLTVCLQHPATQTLPTVQKLVESTLIFGVEIMRKQCDAFESMWKTDYIWKSQCKGISFFSPNLS